MRTDRRHFLVRSAAALTLAGSVTELPAEEPKQTPRSSNAEETNAHRKNRIIVSTYSFWQFRNKDLRDIEKCFDPAADTGFDGVEILHRQLQNESIDYSQRL